jgi:hypothetical protein
MARTDEPVAPRVLDPVLGLVERIDRRLRHIRPIGPGSVLGLERHLYFGPTLTLADGTQVRHGDLAWIIHFDNRRMRQLADGPWPTHAWQVALDDLRLLAALHQGLPVHGRPVAYTGITVLAPLTRRAGFEVYDRAPSPWVRLQDWYLRSVLARWARGGRQRLQQGHRPLRTQTVWLSGAELLRRYGATGGSGGGGASPPPA